uniref:Putative nitrophorin n=1 Tax=Panstrongylus lignarius TaxID=156445 RepID=A0A224XXU6_9HEMI
MYKSTALLVVSLLSLSTAGPLTEECRNIKTMQQFDPVKYFGKTWYVTNTLYTNVEITSDDVACMKSESKLLSNTIVREVDTTYITGSQTYLHSESYINVVDFKEGTGKYISGARPIDKDGRPLLKGFYPLQNNIVHTDYDNHSFVYTCVRTPNGKVLSIYQILSRDSEAKLIGGEILSILEELGLKADDFFQVNHDNCKEGNV